MSFVETLIKLVRESPELYDHQCAGYTDAAHRANKWKLIGDILAEDPEICKKRWRNLRDRYVRVMKSNSEHSKKWEYLDQLQFLNNAIKAERSPKQCAEFSDFNENSNITVDELDFAIKEEKLDPLEMQRTKQKIRFRLCDNDESLTEPQIKKRLSAVETEVLNEFLEKMDNALNKHLNTNDDDDNDVMMRALSLKMRPLPMNVKIKLQEQFLQEINKQLLLYNYS